MDVPPLHLFQLSSRKHPLDTRTQALKGNKDRSEIPGDLFRELFPLIETQMGLKLNETDQKEPETAPNGLK